MEIHRLKDRQKTAPAVCACRPMREAFSSSIKTSPISTNI